MSVIERAARATFDAVQADGAGFSEPWDAPGMARVRETHRKAVIAMLAAIRDVDSGSPKVLVAGKRSLYSCSEDPEIEDARKCWHAMIDTALEEE